jgi:hypothetical protein
MSRAPMGIVGQLSSRCRVLCGRSVLRTVIPESLSSPPSPFTLLHDARTEPWGQTVARLQSSEGAIIGVSHAMHP